MATFSSAATITDSPDSEELIVQEKDKKDAVQAPFPRTSIDDPDRVKRLMENPDDTQLWGEELKRKQELGEFLEKRRTPTRDDTTLELAISNNHQLQGIAFRHLKHYQEALGELSKSQDVLIRLEGQQKCAAAPGQKVCEEIRTQHYLVFTYFANVYLDLKDDVSTEKFLRLAMPLARTQKDYWNQLSVITLLYLGRGEYERAADMILSELEKSLTNSDKASIDEGSRLINSFYLQLFKDISWDPVTGERRSDDPQGFADNFGLGIGKPFKYGMTSADEDDATFATLFLTKELFAAKKDELTSDPTYLEMSGYGSWERLEMNLDINGYVRKQLARNSLEAPAKYLYEQYITYGFDHIGDKNPCLAADKADVTFEEVKDSITKTPASKVDQNTKRIVESFELGYKWIRRHCVSK